MHIARSLSTVLMFLGVAFVVGCEEAVPPPAEIVRPVRATKVGDTETISRRWFSGRAKATREVDLAFRVSGPLVELPIKVLAV